MFSKNANAQDLPDEPANPATAPAAKKSAPELLAEAAKRLKETSEAQAEPQAAMPSVFDV